jgi:hypothetical protein
MRRTSTFSLAVIGCLLGNVQPASAQEDDAPEVAVARGQGWSTLAGKTLGSGSTALIGHFGWPGLSFGVLHGTSPVVDVGAQLVLNYGMEGIVTQVIPGIKVQGLLRVRLFDRGRFNAGLKFAPGPFFYFGGGGFTVTGITLPISGVLGISVGSAVMLNLGMDVPLYVTFGTFGGLTLPVLAGVGAEYFIDRRLAVSFNTRMGPSIRTGIFQRADFAFEAVIGIAYKL